MKFSLQNLFLLGHGFSLCSLLGLHVLFVSSVPVFLEILEAQRRHGCEIMIAISRRTANPD